VFSPVRGVDRRAVEALSNENRQIDVTARSTSRHATCHSECDLEGGGRRVAAFGSSAAVLPFLTSRRSTAQHGMRTADGPVVQS